MQGADTMMAFLAGMCLFILLFAAAAIVIMIFFLLSLQRCFESISPKNRAMSPGMVWLVLIPLFGIVWNFFVVTRLANSAKKEAAEYGISDIGDGGYGIGLTFCILNVANIVISFIPFVGALSGLAIFVLFIIYWVKVSGMTKIFQTAQRETAAPPVV